MLLNKRLNFAVLLPHNTGSATVYEALRYIPDTEDIQPHHGSNISLFKLHSDFFWISTTRHPFLRVVTDWAHCLQRDHALAMARGNKNSERWLKTKRAHDWGFGRFVEHYLYDGIVLPICTATRWHRIDLFLNTSTLKTDFKKIPSRILTCAEVLGHRHKHDKALTIGLYRKFPEVVPLILEYFWEDFERFDYNKDPVEVEAGKIFNS